MMTEVGYLDISGISGVEWDAVELPSQFMENWCWQREALAKLKALGFADTFRLFEQEPESYSWWDYRSGGFNKNMGLRIDLILASLLLAEQCAASYVDSEPRGWERPSDHAPVIAEFRNL